MSLTRRGFFEICVIRVDNCEIGSSQGKSTRINKKLKNANLDTKNQNIKTSWVR